MARVIGKLTDMIKADDPIVKYEGDGVRILTQVCKPVIKIDDDMAEFTDRMAEIMHAANGIGLAAPQLGILQRIIIYDIGEGMRAIINPKILQRKGEQIGNEGCLSIPGLQGDVPRAHEIVVKGLDQFGKPVRIREEGLASRVIQHEVDHLDGILFIGRAVEGSLHWVTPGESDAEDMDEDMDEGEDMDEDAPETRE
jgi:peptide deformylase